MSICESSICKFVKAILIVAIIGLVAFHVNASRENYLTGSAINDIPLNVVEEVPKWKTITDNDFFLGPNRIFMAFGKEQGKTIQTKYKISSSDYVRVYWVSSEADCKAIENSEAFDDYPSCEPQPDETLKFKSRECIVPSDSGICVINENDKEVKISLVIERKQ